MTDNHFAVEARIMAVLREAAKIGVPGISREDAKALLDAFESVDSIMRMLVERQRAKALIDKLQQMKGVAPSIILRLLVKPYLLARLIRELEKEIADELERLRVELLEERRKALQAAIAAVMAWQRQDALSGRRTLRAVIEEAAAEINRHELPLECGVGLRR